MSFLTRLVCHLVVEGRISSSLFLTSGLVSQNMFALALRFWVTEGGPLEDRSPGS